MVCDVKNHLIREVNLHTKIVRHISGVKGVRGCDVLGGELPASEQELASPWDIAQNPRTGEFTIVMAGTHQLWCLDTKAKDGLGRCYRISGSGAEGNLNSSSEESTWAQPSGISIGPFNGEMSAFIADSESSAVRVMSFDSTQASNVAGANDDPLDLFDFGDKEGAGYSAKL